MKSLRSFTLVLALAGAAHVAQADEMTTASVKFSDPGKPGTVKVNVPWADVRVTGADVAEVTVRSSLDEKSRAKETRNGLRRIDDVVSFELVEKDNVVTLLLAGDGGAFGHGAEFELTVPRSSNLVVGNGMGGEVVVKGVEGELDIDSMNGSVTVDGIANAAMINTMNGELTATFARPPEKPVSFSTMNGEINVRLPAATKASLRLRTHNGSILTDFPEDVLKTKAETRTALGDKVSAAAARDRIHSIHDTARSEAAREAAEAVRIAGEVARTVAEEVRREVALAVEEAERASEDTPRTPRAARAPRAPRPPSHGPFGGKSIVGTLNGGGIDISLTSMNGTITLRQAK